MATVLTDLFGAVETLIAGNATFQANTGAADSTAAKEFIVTSFLRGRDAILEKPTIAIIMLAEGNGITYVPLGDSNNLPQYNIEVEIYDIDRKPADPDASQKAFADFVNDVMKEVSDGANTNTYPIRAVTLIGFERTHDVIEQSGDAYWVGAFRWRWRPYHDAQHPNAGKHSHGDGRCRMAAQVQPSQTAAGIAKGPRGNRRVLASKDRTRPFSSGGNKAIRLQAA